VTSLSLRALVRRPSPRLAEGLLTHLDRVPLDAELAARQWGDYVAALSAAGWQPIEVPPADDCPDGVFVEDTMVVYADLAVIARPGAPTRRAETTDAEATVAAAGYRIRHITDPGTLDGGDVLKVGSTVYVGLTERTNAAAADQLAGFFGPLGASVVPVPTTRVLHLKSAVTALPDGRVIGYPPLVDDPATFGGLLAVPEAAGAHVVLLGPDRDGAERLLMAAGAPRTAQQFTELGYRPVLVDISEFEKLEGCVTCLSVRLRGTPAG
jgi:dimethylargininase